MIYKMFSIKKILFLFIILIAGIRLEAQKFDYENPQEYEIAGIKVTGIMYLNADALIQISKLKKGDTIRIPGDDISNAVNKLWKQKMFSDVKIYVIKTEGKKVWLEIALTERPRLSVINFYGIKNSEEEDIREQIQLSRGMQVTENNIRNTKNIIKQYFADKAFSKVEVDIYKKQDTGFQNAALLNVYVNKHGKTRVENIKIDGNTVFTDRNIRFRKLKETKQRRWWGFFKPSKFIHDAYEEDKKNLIKEYRREGYRDVKIVEDSVWDANSQHVNIYLKIDEGKQYFFRDIKWVGNTKYSTDVLQKRLLIKKGDVYDQERLNNRLNMDEDAVGNLYMDNGYLFFNVRPTEVRIEGDSVDIELRIYEGEKARINRVIVKGNDRTNDHVIIRELYTVPGEWFSKTDLIRSVRQIAQLGHFDPEQIVPTPLPNPANGTVDIEYSLVERGNDRVELSGGFGQGMLIASVGLSFNNFSIQNFFDKKAWQPLPMGDGQQLSLQARSNGQYYQNYSISFTEPWLGGKKPNSLTVSAYYNVISEYNWYEQTGSGNDAKIFGSSLGWGSRLRWPDNYFTSYAGASFRQYIINGYGGYMLNTNIEYGRFNDFALNFNFGRNSIDNPLYSRNGSSFNIGVEITPPYSLFNGTDYSQVTDEEKYEWLEYHKWSFKYKWFSQLVGDLVLHTKAEFGVLSYFNQDIGYPPIGGYSLGGDGMSYYRYGTDVIGLRGYENGSLTPSGGGNLYTKYTFELRHPVVLNESVTVYGIGFLEAGNSWSRFEEFNPYEIKRAAGAGMRIFLPMLGLLGFDWGYGFDIPAQSNEVSGGQFHFIMGQQF